jgi:hypothetical protein
MTARPSPDAQGATAPDVIPVEPAHVMRPEQYAQQQRQQA